MALLLCLIVNDNLLLNAPPTYMYTDGINKKQIMK